MYGVPFTTMAVDGPERSGSGKGVPVPRRTIWVLEIVLLCAREMPYEAKRSKTANPTALPFLFFAIIAYSPFEIAPPAGLKGSSSLLHQTGLEMRIPLACREWRFLCPLRRLS